MLPSCTMKCSKDVAHSRDIFCSMQMSLIDEEVVQPIKAEGGKVKVAITMSLLARSCPSGTIYEGKTDDLDQCKSEPLDTARVYRRF